ncbi:PREDICTED: collagen alpha-1(III) chain-like [Dipodomys ordii]|uniref:Collagen alpha-1(III) chain-like n=1 Tax=Dipodomys ordii TaxID=10020 RepID=A0A1S3FTJ4_DIPOR|nr:PREDICTED: collagen alpha-1(III) chain-like [Dipodomys ordii]
MTVSKPCPSGPSSRAARSTPGRPPALPSPAVPRRPIFLSRGSDGAEGWGGERREARGSGPAPQTAAAARRGEAPGGIQEEPESCRRLRRPVNLLAPEARGGARGGVGGGLRPHARAPPSTSTGTLLLTDPGGDGSHGRRPTPARQPRAPLRAKRAPEALRKGFRKQEGRPGSGSSPLRRPRQRRSGQASHLHGKHPAAGEDPGTRAGAPAWRQRLGNLHILGWPLPLAEKASLRGNGQTGRVQPGPPATTPRGAAGRGRASSDPSAPFGGRPRHPRLERASAVPPRSPRAIVTASGPGGVQVPPPEPRSAPHSCLWSRNQSPEDNNAARAGRGGGGERGARRPGQALGPGRRGHAELKAPGHTAANPNQAPPLLFRPSPPPFLPPPVSNRLSLPLGFPKMLAS